MKLQEMLREEWEEGHEEGLIESIIIQKFSNNILSIEQAAGKLGVTTDEFQKKVDKYLELQASLQ